MKLLETVQPFSFSHTIRSNKFTTDLHKHEPMELFYIRRGIIECVLPTQEEIDSCKEDYNYEILRSGQLAIIYPYQIHRLNIMTESEYFMCELGNAEQTHIPSFPVTEQLKRNSFLSQIPNSDKLFSTKNYYIINCVNDAGKCFSRFIELLTQKNKLPPEVFAARYELALYNLFFYLGECCESPTLLQYSNKHLNKAIYYINENYTRDISIEKIASFVGISATYLQILFKETYGYPISSFIRDCRLKLAKKLLSNSDLSLNLIAKQIGYNSLRAFEYAFTNYYGENPTDYKKHSFLTHEQKKSDTTIYHEQFSFQENISDK